MSEDAFEHANGADARSGDRPAPCDPSPAVMNAYEDLIAARATHLREQRAYMLVTYAEMRERLESQYLENLETAKSALRQAEAALATTSVRTLGDLALKIDAASANDFGSEILKHGLIKEAEAILWRSHA